MAEANNTIANDIVHYGCYPIFIVGSLANILCIAVLFRPKMRATNMGFYLLALSVTDLLVLNVSLMERWLLYSHGIDPRVDHEIVCKILPFLDKFLLQMASWIVVAVSLERAVAVCKPIFYRTIGQWHRNIVLITLSVLLFIINSPILHFYELNDRICCTVAPDAFNTFSYVVFYLLYWFLPLVCLLVSSTLIIFKLREKNFIDSTGRPKDTLRKKTVANENVFLLLFINCMFIASISPFAVCGIWKSVLESGCKNSSSGLYDAFIITRVFSKLNNAVNFVPYMLMSSLFRMELKALFRIKNSSSVLELEKSTATVAP